MVYSLQHTEIDWGYHAQPSTKYCLSTRNGSYWPRGRVLGGSGSINAMKYVRGNRKDYDRWMELGNAEWGWTNVVRYFKKSEDMKVPQLMEGDGARYHSTGGYLSIDNYDMSDPLHQIILNAADERGYKRIEDFNREDQMGYGRVQFTIVNATRTGPAKAFLSSARGRDNLHVIKYAFATSVKIDQQNVAKGVHFDLGDQQLMASARKEVILSAGAINTPQLLMLSGIGRARDLTKLNITPKSNLNVGYSLQDHVTVPLFFKLNKSHKGRRNLQEERLQNLFLFTMMNRSQPLSYRDLSSTMGFANTLNSSDPYPDVQFEYYQLPKDGNNSYLLSKSFEYNDEVSASIREAEQEANVMLVRIVLMIPKSRGRITLASSSPYDHPIIEPNYFGDIEDLRTIVRAIRLQQQFLQTKAFRENEAELHRMDLSGCKDTPYDTDDYWDCYIRHMTLTLYHPIGTAKMGPNTDPEAVVDSRLRVKGVQRLRVVDASIMPELMSGNTNGPVMMIGEMGSDFIKFDHAIATSSDNGCGSSVNVTLPSYLQGIKWLCDIIRSRRSKRQ